MIVPIQMAAQLAFGVVEVNHRQILESDLRVKIAHHAVQIVNQIVARRQGVTGIEADRQTIAFQ